MRDRQKCKLDVRIKLLFVYNANILRSTLTNRHIDNINLNHIFSRMVLNLFLVYGNEMQLSNKLDLSTLMEL